MGIDRCMTVRHSLPTPTTGTETQMTAANNIPELFRLGVIGTKGRARRYVSGTADRVKLSGRADALHWNKREACILADAFNTEFASAGRPERFQIEKA